MRYTPLEFNVQDNRTLRIIVAHSTAEAQIIAFALNAVAEGRELLSVDKDRFAESHGWNADPYDGPTEGITL